MKTEEVLKILGILGLFAGFILLFLAGVDSANSEEFTMVSVLFGVLGFILLCLSN